MKPPIRKKSLHIEEPLRAEWEITALAMKLEKAQRFPILVCHNVIVDGKRAELPLVTFLMASRLRLARTFGVDVRRAGVACYERVQKRVKPVVVSRDAGAGETGRGKRRGHRCAPFSRAAASPHGSGTLCHAKVTF